MSERRELLLADLDSLDPERLLWWPPASADPDRARIVRRALACLTDKQREVVTAHFFEGRSQSDIARRLGVSQQVVHKRIFGVRRKGRWVGGALKRLAAHLGPLLDMDR